MQLPRVVGQLLLEAPTQLGVLLPELLRGPCRARRRHCRLLSHLETEKCPAFQSIEVKPSADKSSTDRRYQRPSARTYPLERAEGAQPMRRSVKYGSSSGWTQYEGVRRYAPRRRRTPSRVSNVPISRSSQRVRVTASESQSRIEKAP